jgi:phosphatidate cytidylyltransferase
MIIKRVATALAGIPLAIYLINSGGLLFTLAITLLALIAWHEYYRMLAYKQVNISYSLGIVSTLLILGCSWLGNSQELLMVLTVSVLISSSLAIFGGSAFSLHNVAFTISGIAYIALPFAHLLLLRLTDTSMYLPSNWGGSLSAGAVYLWLAFIGTWTNDTFAFLVGSKWGKRKLCPSVSPGKTVEGALGGLIGSVLGIVAFGSIYGLPLFHLIIIGFLVGITAPLGDLTESAIKRYTGVKDSGRLLPGHGGVLDRFDSIMFAVPVVYYYIKAFLLH